MNEPADGTRRGETYTFVSSKGGTGKTIIAASFAYTLRACGHRVVIVDTDFATRGMSLYLLAAALESEDVLIEPQNCLADAILAELSAATIEPRTLHRDGTTYDVVFANRDVFGGGAPEERLLGFGEESVEAMRYREFMAHLLKHLANRYDYVIVDTRGGIDLTSVVPAVESDGFVVILEADQLSLDQVHGLLAKIEQHVPRGASTGSLRGFIVNKGIFSPEDKSIERTLARLYRGARLYGIIPADDDVIRAYQKEQIPLQSIPGAAFSYYALSVFARMFDLRRWSSEAVEEFEALRKRSEILYATETRATTLVARLPYVHLIVLVIAIIYYVAFRTSRVSTSTGAYVALAIALLFSLGTATIGVLRALRRRATSRALQVFMRMVLVAIVCVALYLLVIDVPIVFSRTPLLARLADQQASLSSCRQEFELSSDRLNTTTARLDLLERERSQLTAALADVRRSFVTAGAERDDLQARLETASTQLTRVTRDRDNLIRQLETRAETTGTQ